ncbi:carboxypeptidase regulatory-like domain-containing protein [bacterium]|nr:carboxypeptidase regulatory-like domain-containing protein [bacterium]
MKNLYIILLFLSVFTLGALASTGGPDAFGYRWIDSEEPSGPAFDWIEISTTGTRVTLSDDAYSTVRFTDRTFEYYGIDYSQVHINSNGWISLLDGTTYITVGPFPNSSYPNAVMGIVNMDFDPADSPGGSVYYQFIDNLMVIEYYQIREYPGGTSYPPYTYEIILDFVANSIKYQYLVVQLTSYRTGYVGIENETGTIGLQYGTHTSVDSDIHDSLAILFRSNIVIAPFYYNDFTLSGNDFMEDIELIGEWEWGTPIGAGPGGAHSTPYCFGTFLAGNHTDYANYSLLAPRMDLYSAQHPYVLFWHWYETEESHDGGNIKITTDDGITWELITPDDGYPVDEMGAGTAITGEPAFSGSSGGWERVKLNLEPFLLEEVRLKFDFASDAENTMPGWYIDDFSLLEKFGTLEGNVDIVADDYDRNARVEIVELGKATLTGEAGYYSIDSVMIGSYTIRVSKNHYVTIEEPDVAITEFDTTVVDFELHPNFGFIKGYVDLLYEDVDEGAVVEILELGKFDTTDAEGNYFIDTVEIGTYSISVTKPHYVSSLDSGVVVTELDTVIRDYDLFPELYNCDFELEDGALIPDPPDSAWEWGTPDPDYLQGPRWANSGSNCWGTNLDGEYGDNVNWKLDLSVFLGIAEYPAMRMMHWYRFNGETSSELFEGGNVKISIDGGDNFELLVPLEGYINPVSYHNIYMAGEPAFGGMDNGNFWHMVNYDLRPYAGESALIRFSIGTDYHSGAAGWYLDDIQVYEWVDVPEATIKTPDKLALVTYPNPFNATLNLNFAIDRHGSASLEVYDLLGKKVGTVFNAKVIKGVYRTSWEMPEGQPSGIYFVKLTVQNRSIINKVLLLK